MLWSSPTGPIVGFAAALIVGAITTVVAGRRLSRAIGSGTSSNRDRA
jgi:preprotein translocase subunit SecD